MRRMMLMVVLVTVTVGTAWAEPKTKIRPSNTITFSTTSTITTAFDTTLSRELRLGQGAIRVTVDAYTYDCTVRLAEAMQELIARDPEAALPLLLSKKITVKMPDGTCIGYECQNF